MNKAAATPEYRLLLVEDEEIIREIVALMLARYGFATIEATSGEEAVEIAAAQPFDAVLLDLGLPGMSGEECLARLRERCPGCPVVIASGYSDADSAATYKALGAQGFAPKPYDFPALAGLLRSLLETR